MSRYCIFQGQQYSDGAMTCQEGRVMKCIVPPNEAQSPFWRDEGQTCSGAIASAIREPVVSYVDNTVIVYRLFGPTQFTIKNMTTGAELTLRGGAEVASKAYFFDRTLTWKNAPKSVESGDRFSTVYNIVKVEPVNPRLGFDVTGSADIREANYGTVLMSSQQFFSVIDYDLVFDNGSTPKRENYVKVVPPNVEFFIGPSGHTHVNSVYRDVDFASHFDHPDRRRI